jgi:outer membrane protein assembly factor BamB
MKKLSVLIPVLILVFCAEQRTGTDWPTFRGNYDRTGYSPDVGPSDTARVAWRIDLGAYTSSSPIIADGRMYLGYEKGMICADPYSGKIHWEFSTNKRVFSTPTYYDGDIVFGSWDKFVYRLDGKTGDVIWDTEFPAVVDCSPVIFDGKVYAGDFLGLFTTIEFDNGYVGRIYSTGDWLVGSAAFDGEILYFGSKVAIFYALNKETFKPKWEFEPGGDISSTPAIDTSRVYFGSNNNMFHCLDIRTGKMIWQFATNGLLFSSPAIHGERVFFGAADSTVYCLNKYTGDEIWQYRTNEVIYSSAAVCGDRVYIGSQDGYIYALDSETGALIWKKFLGAPITSSPVIYDDMLIVPCDNGSVFAFR